MEVPRICTHTAFWNQVGDIEEIILLLLSVAIGSILQRCVDHIHTGLKHSRKRHSQCWVRSWLQRRHQLGVYDTLMIELANRDMEGYVAFQRMAPDFLFKGLIMLRVWCGLT